MISRLPEGESGLEMPPEEWVAAVMHRFDTDEDGLLSKREFGAAIQALERSGWHAPSVVLEQPPAQAALTCREFPKETSLNLLIGEEEGQGNAARQRYTQ